MGECIEFTIYGEPVAQGRPRAGRTFSGQPVMYDPSKSRHYKQYIKLAAAQHKPKQLLDGPLQLEVDIYRFIPKSTPKYRRKQIEAGTYRPTVKPDVDNYIKGIKDGLNGVIWTDDNLIVDLTVRKWYSNEPRIEVKVTPVEVDQDAN